MSRKSSIEKKLSVLSPHMLNVINESAKHAGHSGNPDGGDDTHFTIIISADELDSLSKVGQHRIINNLLKDEFDTGLHALSIKVVSTKEEL